MPYPSKQEIIKLFQNLEAFPEGHECFFSRTIERCSWTITGQHPFSGHWTSTQSFLQAVWWPNTNLMASPGPTFILPEGHESVIYNDQGEAAVELRTIRTVVKQHGREYNQHYSWHCRFNEDGLLVSVKIFLDSIHAKEVLLI
ncbi:uncharacterized protein LDX57_004861 [Aspergillus melleus]|uniref:uncharacterized protein n=1 Tax=Aspergillus melleus TaxID=138277 RepID=UPI001E8CA75F|nr:uncharacterized protein LDX57_004861 [Aspergillus melleus]KAH8427144.1 hypothetical protein LDX57_004861 [Aspergillus melleus]